jgi:undecaprenyl-diphosphatase
MRPARAFALGLLHGPAELLPVSSSAHAALLLQDLDPERRKEAEVALHAGTLAALGPPRLAPWLVLSTLPPAVAGLLFEKPIQERLGTRRGIAAGLVAGGIAMVVADGVAPARRRGLSRRGRRPSRPRPSAADALVVGLAQAAALVPGVSRHGAALTALRARGFAREDAHAISREAAKPVLAGAAALKAFRFAASARSRATSRPEGVALAAATAGSALSTLLAARALERRGVRAPLWPFALYRAGLAAVLAAT